MRILAGMLSFCVLVTACPDMPAPRSVSAAEETTETGEQYISRFAQLPEEIREQTVPVGTALEELALPDTLEAVVTAAGESLPSEDTEDQPGDDGKDGGGVSGAEAGSEDDSGKEDGGVTGGETDDGETGGGEDDGTTGVESGDGETGDKEDGGASDGETNVGESSDKEDDRTSGGESDNGEGGTEESETSDTEQEDTKNGDETDAETAENGAGENALLEERCGSESVRESAFTAERRESGNTQETHTVTLPEYYAEHVISVQTLENTQTAQEESEKEEQEEAQAGEQQESETETQEETIAIDGVTWRSEPEYDGNTEGIYTFTAVLPEGYALAEGVSLPEITVTVQEIVRRAMSRAAMAAADGNHGNHSGWIALTSSTSTLTGGKNYYLAGDVEVRNEITVTSGTVTLCLNNHTLTRRSSNEKYWVITVADGATLNVYDCADERKGTITVNSKGGGISTAGTLNVYGGTISGKCAENDGQDKNNLISLTYYAGIFAQAGSEVNLYGGTVQGTESSGVYVADDAKLTVDGAEVICRVSSMRVVVAGIYIDGEAEIKSGTVSRELSTDAWNSCTIKVSPGGSLTISGGVVSESGSRVGGISIGKDYYHTLSEAAHVLISGGTVLSPVSARSGMNIKITGGSVTRGVALYGSVLEMPGSQDIHGDTYDFYIDIDRSDDASVRNIFGKIKLTGALTNTEPYKVALGSSLSSAYPAIITENFSTHMSGKEPADYFTSVDGYKVILKDGEVAFTPYVMTFDANGGSVDTTQGDINGGNRLRALPTPTRAHYTFAGWFTQKDGGEQITIDEMPKGEDITVYAHWTPNTYTVTYNKNSGIIANESNYTSYTYGTGLTLPMPTRTGYTFGGWYENAGFTGNKVTGISTTATGNQTYYAKWTANTYTVTYNKDSGSIADESNYTSYTYGTGLTLPTPTRRGYSFSGWYDNADCDGTPVTVISASDIENKTFWAKWTDDIAPVIGTLRYSYEPKSLWHWLIGKDSLTITVPVTEEGSGADEITYTATPEGGAAEEKTAALTNGTAEITVSADFKGTISIVCTDKAGNVSAGVTVGAGLDASGVIIEDNAPDIVIKADRSPSDAQQTQPDGVAVEDRYYETVPALLVTVKDDTDNAITGGLAAITYQVGNGAAKTVTVDQSSLQESVQAAFSIPEAEITTGITEVTVTATDNAGNTAVKKWTIKVKGPENKPAAEIDYRKEKLTGLAAGGTYRINDKEYTADGEGCIPIKEEWMGTTVTIVKAGNGSETTDSPAQNLPIPARPAKPTPTGEDVAVPGGTGKLTGLTADTAYEVSTDGGKTWVSRRADGNGVITGLAPGAYTVRVEAGASNFVSENSSPARIGAYQIKVTFVVDGETCREVFVDYGGTLADIPPVPPVEDAVGAWCSDRQGTTPAVFTDITADMTVYAVYTYYYTVTLQGGAGYTLTAETGSESPVKEGGSFTFRFALGKGYQRTESFAVKVNGAAVELTAEEPYTYTISDIRAHQTVTVEGVAKKPGGNPSSGSSGDKDKGDGSDQKPDDPASNPAEADPDTQTPGSDNPENQTPNPPVTPPAKQTPPAQAADAVPGTTPPAGRTPEGRPGSTPGSTPGQGETGTPEGTDHETDRTGAETQEADSAGDVPGAGGTDAQTQNTDGTAAGMTEGGVREEKTEVNLGDGKVIVTVAYEEEKCTAAVADAEAVAKAVLKPEQQAKVNGGETIEIRVDVTDISEKVPEQDKEVIESGVEAYREEAPGLVLGMYVDISMFIKIGVGDWNAIATTDAPIEVVIGIPEKLQSSGREFYIIRAHEGEHTLLRDLDGAPDTITVSTDMFSSYAIAFEETEGAGADRKCGLCHICPTFLGICYFIWLALALAVIGIVMLVVVRRRKEEETEREK